MQLVELPMITKGGTIAPLYVNPRLVECVYLHNHNDRAVSVVCIGGQTYIVDLSPESITQKLHI